MTPYTQDQQLNYLLHQLDLSAVRCRFQRIHARSLSHAVKRIELEYRKLMALKFVHGDSHGHLLGAPKLVRNFWEQHVLDTASYLGMLDRLGMRIHFNPDSNDLATDKAQARRLLNSADCYKARFGVDPPTDVWGKNEEATSESEDEAEELTAVDQDSESPQPAEPFLIVFVQTMTGKIIDVRLAQDVSVDYLKGTIEDLEGLPADQQRLIFAGKQLEDGRYLMSDYGVRARDVLKLVMRLRAC